LAGAALGVFLAGSFSAAADAKTRHHAHHAKAAPSATAALQGEVETLSNAVSDLENRLNDTTQQLQATQAHAQAAEAEAAAAKADVQETRAQLDTQIQTIPGVVNTAVAAHKPKPSWADNTKVTSTVFANLSYDNQSPKPNKFNGVGVDIKRAYLGVSHQFNDIYSATLTADFAPNGVVLNGGALQGAAAIKYAYLQAKYSDAFIVQLGSEDTPWIGFATDVYGYRYIEKTIVDQQKYGNSADWGANVHGSLAKGLVSYSAMAMDGGGYKNPTRSKTMDFEGRANLNYDGFVAGVGGYDGNLATNFQGGPPTHNVSRIDALVAYTNDKFRIGGEFFQAWNWKTPAGTAAAAAIPATTATGPCTVGGVAQTCTVQTAPAIAAVAAGPAKNDRSIGYSIFGSYTFIPQWSIFARYDDMKPSQLLDPREHFNYYNAGVSYDPVKNLSLALVYKHEGIRDAIKGGYSDFLATLASGSTLTYNTTTHVYTTGAGSPKADLDEFGLYTRFQF
jgi:hypothetical protein